MQGGRRWARGASSRACVGAWTGAGQAAERVGRALGAEWHGRVGCRRGRAAGRCRRAGGPAGARQGERAAGPRARGVHAVGAGRTAWALGVQPVRMGWASWVLVHPARFSTLVFRLGIFPESPNEHCAL